LKERKRKITAPQESVFKQAVTFKQREIAPLSRILACGFIRRHFAQNPTVHHLRGE
jgi:hypothetical protein